MKSQLPSKNKQDKPGLNLIFNIVAPAVIMMKAHSWFGLSPTWALSLALSFPLAYGLYDLLIKKTYNMLSIIGFVSILLTGSIGLMHLPKEWIAIKEAAVPLTIGIALLVTAKMRNPIIKTLIYNDNILKTDKINAAIETQGNTQAFDNLLTRATFLVSGSFFISAVLNYILAIKFIQSETGTQAFTEELGKMTAWSYPIIALPCSVMMIIALWKLIQGISELSGLAKEEMFASA